MNDNIFFLLVIIYLLVGRWYSAKQYKRGYEDGRRTPMTVTNNVHCIPVEEHPTTVIHQGDKVIVV